MIGSSKNLKDLKDLMSEVPLHVFPAPCLSLT